MTLNLTQQAGLDWSGRHEWHKGQSYIKRLNHLVARPQKNAIYIRCKAYGQEKDQRQAIFQGDQVLSAHCSYSIGNGRYCKYVATLLNKTSSDPMALTIRDLLDSALDMPKNNIIILKNAQSFYKKIEYSIDYDLENIKKTGLLGLIEQHFPECRKLPALRDELDQAGVLPK